MPILTKWKQVGEQLDRIEGLIRVLSVKVDNLTQRMNKMATDNQIALASLQAEVAAAITVEESAIALINGFQEQLSAVAAANDVHAALAALQTQLAAEGDKLAAAVTANTPAASTASVAPAITPILIPGGNA